MQAQSIAVVQRATPTFNVFSEARAEDLKLIGVTKTFGRDQEVFGDGESPDFVYRVVAGAVRSFRVLADGRRQIDDFFLPGDVFGIEMGSRRTSAAEAIGEATLVLAKRSTVASDQEQAARLWRQTMEQLRRAQDHVLTLGRRTATERVASFLIDLVERLDTAVEIDLPMSRQDMADYLGLTIETVSRTMTHLQARGLIRLAGCRRVRLLRPAALADLCE
jgi:CRP/FNR family nitrogen fixation transcriptional regulator